MKRWKSIATALVALLMVMPLTSVAGEGDGSTQMQDLESRLLALEDELKATRSALDTSEQIRRDVAPSVEAGSGLDTFLSGLQVGGFVEASYLYNFNNPDSNAGYDPVTGLSGHDPQVLWQFNRNHNTFELDAVKLELGKPASDPGTAGFQLDLLFGANHHLLCDTDRQIIDDVNNAPVAGQQLTEIDRSDDGVCVQEAYVSYNWDGYEIWFGKWETLLGYEVIDAPYNNHVSHGILFTWAIPLVHNGILVKGAINENVGFAVGVANGFNNMTDSGDNKGVLGQLNYTDGPLYVAVSTFIGSEEHQLSSNPAPGAGVVFNRGKNDEQVWIYDLVVTYDLSNEVALWLNADYANLQRDNDTVATTFGASTKSNPSWYGLAGGFTYAINEKTTFAARGEYMVDDGGARFSSELLGPNSDTRIATGTATLAYALTNNLSARAEFRHDRISNRANQPFVTRGDGFCDAGNCSNSVDVGIVEVNYQFD